MMARRRAMMAKPAMNPTMMKEGGKADMAQDKAMIKKAFKQHDSQEHMGGKGTSLKLKHGGKFATGGVVNGQGGFAKGGIIDSKKGNTKVVTSKPDHSPANTGGVKLGNGGGYKNGGLTMVKKNGKMVPDFAADGKGKMAKGGMMEGCATGGVAKANGGGYKMGGSTKKAYATGGTVDTGKPVAMPRKPASKPVVTKMVSGTFAKGGKVEKEEKPNLRPLMTHTGPKGHVAKVYKDKDYGEHRVKFFDSDGKHRSASDYHTDDLSDAHDTAKSQLNRYKQGGTAKRYAEGDLVDASKGAYDAASKPSKEDMDMAKTIRSIPSKLYEGAKSMMGMTPKPAGSVTKTEKSVTVAPASKKRGGGC
jgi:hypothetical protein